MRDEIAAAVVFITRLLKKNEDLPREKVEDFSSRLSAILCEKFKNHWYQDNPHKGQAYRCIRINDSGLDPVISQAAKDSGLINDDLKLPPELTLWVDPNEVCCRFGEIKGSYCTVASFRDGSAENYGHIFDIESVIPKNWSGQGKQKSSQQSDNTHKAYYGQFKVGNSMHNALHHKNIASNMYNNYRTSNKSSKNTPPLPHAGPTNKHDRYHWVRGANLIRT